MIISLDGYDYNSNRYRFKKPFQYDLLLKKIKLLKDNNINYGISMVLNKNNYLNITDHIQKIYEKFKPASFGVNLPHFSENKQHLQISEDKYSEIYKNLALFSLNNGIYIDQIARKLNSFINQKFRLRDCSGQGRKIVYFPGNIQSNCINYFNDNIKIWGNRIPLNDNRCSNCIAIGICGGGCIFDSLSFNNKCNKFDIRHCSIVKTFIYTFIEFLSINQNTNINFLLNKYKNSIEFNFKTDLYSAGH